MANPTIPEFTDLAARKLAELQANGYRITGVCFERQVEGTQPQRGFVDFAGFVGWWRAEMQPRKPLTEARRDAIWEEHRYADGDGWVVDCGSIIDAVEAAHSITAHGVADMKGGQDD